MLKLGGGRSIRLSKWLAPGTTLLDICSGKIVSVGVKDSVEDVLEIFAKKFRRAPVIDDRGYVRGMVSASDVLKVLGGWLEFSRIEPRKRLDVKMGDIMSAHLLHIDGKMDLPSVIDYFRRHRRGAFPVLRQKKLEGMITEHDIVRQIKGKTGIRTREAMVRKPIVAQDTYTTSDVAKMLSMGGFRRLPVMRDGALVGIITPRDILGYLYQNNLTEKVRWQGHPVRSIMTEDVATTGPDADLHEAVRVIVERKVGGLPVVSGSDLLGIITERDIVDAVQY